MSVIGPVARGSTFSFLQSAGVVGLGIAAAPIFLVGGGVALSGFGIYKLFKKREDEQNVSH